MEKNKLKGCDKCGGVVMRYAKGFEPDIKKGSIVLCQSCYHSLTCVNKNNNKCDLPPGFEDMFSFGKS